MHEYVDMIRYILDNGENVPTRAILKSTGKNVNAITTYGYQNSYSLVDQFPILTTKKISFKNIAHEMIWFLRGEINIKYLTENNVHIWDEWTNEQGNVGPVYGQQWRHWEKYKVHEIGGDGLLFDGCEYVERVEIDQVAELIDNIKKCKLDLNHSSRRRLIISAWNVGDVPEMKLPCCHILCQFFIHGGDKLSCKLYQRSADAFLGVPYNISSYALLTYIIAHLTGLKPHVLYHSFGDLHIYENHLDVIEQQLNREPRTLPKLVIKNLSNINEICIDNFELINYNPCGTLKGEVAV